MWFSALLNSCSYYPLAGTPPSKPPGHAMDKYWLVRRGFPSVLRWNEAYMWFSAFLNSSYYPLAGVSLPPFGTSWTRHGQVLTCKTWFFFGFEVRRRIYVIFSFSEFQLLPSSWNPPFKTSWTRHGQESTCKTWVFIGFGPNPIFFDHQFFFWAPARPPHLIPGLYRYHQV